jgi:hypothetical protein
MSANHSKDRHPGRPSADPARLALLASCGIFVLAFSAMIVIGLAKVRVPEAGAIIDTCQWLVALTASAIVGLIARGRQ